MRVPRNTNSVPKAVPKWAKERINKILKAGEKLKSEPTNVPDGFVKRRLSEEQAVLGHWTARTGHSRYKTEDNEARDQDPTPGVVDHGFSKIHVEGGFRNGSLMRVAEEQGAVDLTYHQGNSTETVSIRKNGAAYYNYYNSKNPEKSVAVETVEAKAARTKERVSEHFSATKAASELISDKPGETLEEQAANLFFHQRDNIPAVRQEILSGLAEGVEALPAESQLKLKKLLSKPNAHTPAKLGQELLSLSKQDPQNKKLKELRNLSGIWQVLEDVPKLRADGLVRTQEHYMAPAGLQLATAAQNWDFDKKTGLPIADTIVIGGGPGGLATGFHLSKQGQRTVIFEGGKIGQAFSDASAQSVHQLRTTQWSSDLIYTNANNDLGIDVSLRRHAENIYDKGKDAKESWNEMRGEADHSTQEGVHALNRNNLFEHMMQLGHGLATKHPDTFLLENSPITSIVKEQRGDETLLRVKSAKGHEMLTKSLVMATGFVGSNGEYARGLKQFSQFGDSVTVLGSDHDLVGKNDQLPDESKSLVFSDRLVGRPEIRERIKSLPEGANLAVIGSGESAAKGVIEALHLNPGLEVSLYTKNPLEPYQVQIPVSHFSSFVTEHGIKNKDIADKTMEEFKQLKTPITTETMKTLLSFEAEGRLKIKELGKRFDDSTVDVKLKKDGGFQFDLKDQEVAQTLQEQRQSWAASGLYGAGLPDSPADQLEDADMVMVAVGYDTTRVNASPLMQQLIDQDLVEIKDGRVQYGEDGLTSSLSPMVGFNTAGAVRMSADTALPGRAVRGLRLAQNLAEKLPQREAPEDSIGQNLEFAGLDTNSNEEYEVAPKEHVETLLSFKTNGYRPRPEWQAGLDSEADKAWMKSNAELEKRFAGPNSTVRAIVGRYQEFPETLTPAEKLTAQRAIAIAERLENLES